jgi:outer membrane lipoprotein-sorting protein
MPLCRPVFVALLLLLAGGCAHHVSNENIPHYPQMDAPASLRHIAEQARQVKTLSSEGLITLTRPDGESVRLDAAMAMRPPELARMRAWKFGRGIFDLTVTPDGVWAVIPEDPKRKEQITSAGVSAAKLAKTWSILAGGFFDSPGLTTEIKGPNLFVRRQSSDEPVVVCEVDRDTLTPRKYRMLDDKGVTRFSLTLDDYQQYGQVVWPTKLTAVSDSGTVEIELHDVEVNPELPAQAFVAPRRAEKLP